MHHAPEFTVVLVVGVALAAGAAMRIFSARLPVPYTVAMLLIGLGLGWAFHDSSNPEHGGLLGTIASAAEFRPELIILVFLPALIFESAFAMNVHAFRKALGAIAVLAVPALLIATGLTALLVYSIVPDSWGWTFSVALVFGALISATDPVAVVALMRELGASPKLSTLIEGESLLNDGTAIVVFTVVFALATNPAASFDLAPVLVRFVAVVAGGLLVGLVLAVLFSWWIGRSENDSLVEITLTVVLGYAAMLIAEGLLHVSGVMALVVAGLYMAGYGRTRISPEVQHFLHQFWAMLAYIANTLVFFLVGLVVGSQIQTAQLVDLLLIVGVWAGIMVIRTFGTFLCRPLVNAVTSEKMSVGDAVVASWGGLRGAVSMALALIVAQNDALPLLVREKLLLVTAGVVFLTLVVNGRTTGALLRAFGYDRAPLSERLAQLSALGSVHDGVSSELSRLAETRELRTVKWSEVQGEIHAQHEALRAQASEIRAELASATPAEREAGYWRQALAVERGAYWKAFSNRTLGAAAVRVLDHEIEIQLDGLGQGVIEPPATRYPRISPLHAWLRRKIRGQDWYGRYFAPLEFDNLVMLYDLSRGEHSAAAAVLEWLPQLHGLDEDVRNRIRATYSRYLQSAKERLEETRVNLPEITEAIEKRLAEKIALQLERRQYERLATSGALDIGSSEGLIADVDARMARLRRAPRRLPLPDAGTLLRAVPLLQPLGDALIDELAQSASLLVVPSGEQLFCEGDSGDSLYVVARGAVHVLRQIEGMELLVDVLGGGDILGEMALLTGEPRTATIRAASSVTLVKLSRAEFVAVIHSSPELEREVWSAFARRSGDNVIAAQPRYRHLDREARVAWVGDREHIVLSRGQEHTAADDDEHALVLIGELCIGDDRHTAPAIVPLAAAQKLRAESSVRFVLLPPAP